MGDRCGVEPQSKIMLRIIIINTLYQGATLHNVPSNYHCSGLTNGFGLLPHLTLPTATRMLEVYS